MLTLVTIPGTVTDLIQNSATWFVPWFTELWPYALWGLGIYAAFIMIRWGYSYLLDHIYTWLSPEYRYEKSRRNAMATIRANRELDEDFALWQKSKGFK